jgi:hypothetical protein
VDPNPVAEYAFFCEQYNHPCNVVDGIAYQAPSLNSCSYRLYRFVRQHSFAGMTESSWCSSFGSLNCESYCCLFQALYAIVNLIFPLALGLLALFSGLFFGVAGITEDYALAKGCLIPTISFYLVAVLLFGYLVCYQLAFFRLVERNFALVPRRKVLSNMVYFRSSSFQNKYLEISGHLAAALRRGELACDQINNQAVIRSLSVNVGV